MKPFPEPQIDDAREKELLRLLEKGFVANRWRPDYQQWTTKRIWAEKYQETLIRKLERLAGPLAGKQILDVGSGRGGLEVAMKLRNAHPIAMDLRRRNCRILRLRGARYDTVIPSIQAMGEAIPFRSDVFDLVICKDVIEHCRKPESVLGEIARVLRPGGCAYVTFINRLAWDDPHYHIHGINFLPRAIAEIVVARSGRSKKNERDLQRLSDMHYHTVRAARRISSEVGLQYRDVTLEGIQAQGSSARQVFHNLLSITAGTLESLLIKPKP